VFTRGDRRRNRRRDYRRDQLHVVNTQIDDRRNRTGDRSSNPFWIVAAMQIILGPNQK